jgi:hypothetical protein
VASFSALYYHRSRRERAVDVIPIRHPC